MKPSDIIFNLFIVAATVCLLAFLFFLNSAPGILRVIMALVLLAVSGEVLRARNKLQGAAGLVMLKTKVGINLINRTSRKNPNAWRFFADWGLAVSFGLLSYLLFRKRMNKWAFVLGIATLIFIIIVVFPATILAINVINIPQVQSAAGPALSCISQAYNPAAFAASIPYSVTDMLLVIVSLVGGLALVIPFFIILNAGSILYAIAGSIPSAAAGNYSTTYNAINSQVPGVAPLIPGITIPLAAGIITLFILLAIHEFSHGVLSRISKVRVKSTGLLLFGIIPIGAFVEPDEKKIRKLGKVEQNRISVAGVSANLVATLVFFAMTMLFLAFVLPYITQSSIVVIGTIRGYPAYNVIPPGSVLVSINNITLGSTTALAALESRLGQGAGVAVRTENATYYMKTGSGGKLGVFLCNSSVVNPAAPLGPEIYFIYIVVILSLLLNFSVAAVNLLPLPGLDGWRIYSLELGGAGARKLLYAIGIIMLFALIVNLLPLLTYII